MKKVLKIRYFYVQVDDLSCAYVMFTFNAIIAIKLFFVNISFIKNEFIFIKYQKSVSN